MNANGDADGGSCGGVGRRANGESGDGSSGGGKEMSDAASSDAVEDGAVVAVLALHPKRERQQRRRQGCGKTDC